MVISSVRLQKHNSTDLSHLQQEPALEGLDSIFCLPRLVSRKQRLRGCRALNNRIVDAALVWKIGQKIKKL